MKSTASKFVWPLFLSRYERHFADEVAAGRVSLNYFIDRVEVGFIVDPGNHPSSLQTFLFEELEHLILVEDFGRELLNDVGKNDLHIRSIIHQYHVEQGYIDAADAEHDGEED